MLSLLAVALFAPPPLVVVRPDGLHVINPRGKVIRTLTREPVRWAHRLPGGPFVVDRGGKGLAVVSTKGTVRELGVLPEPDGCRLVPGGDEPLLALQSTGDVNHSPDGRWLCLTLMDRNANMADVSVDYEVDLITGEISAEIGLAPGCPDPTGGASRCSPARPPARAAVPARRPKAPKAWPYTWDEERAALIGKAGAALDFCVGRPKDSCDTPSTAAVSPSGRWRLIRLPTTQGDYMHHGLYAVDHKTAALHPIREGRWPAPLTPTQVQQLLRNYEAIETLDVVGEAFIAPTGHGERFAVDAVLVSPGERVLPVGQLVP